MLETLIRSRIQPVFKLLGRLAARWLTPNDITIAGASFGLIAGIAIAFHYSAASIICLWISGMCDVLDGTVARLTNNSQKIGAYIDLITDRIVEGAFIIGCAYAYPHMVWACMFFFFAVLLHFATFVTAGALFENRGEKSIHYEASIVERSEAFIFFTAMALWPGYAKGLLILLNGIIFGTAIARFVRMVKIRSSKK